MIVKTTNGNGWSVSVHAADEFSPVAYVQTEGGNMLSTDACELAGALADAAAYASKYPYAAPDRCGVASVQSDGADGSTTTLYCCKPPGHADTRHGVDADGNPVTYLVPNEHDYRPIGAP